MELSSLTLFHHITQIPYCNSFFIMICFIKSLTMLLNCRRGINKELQLVTIVTMRSPYNSLLLSHMQSNKYLLDICNVGKNNNIKYLADKLKYLRENDLGHTDSNF